MTLRIQKSAERELIVFKLAGRIQANQLPDLEALLNSEPSDGDVVLDLEEVKLVDREAVQFLAQREAEGANLRNCAAYIRAWVSQERNGAKPYKSESNEPGE